MIWSDELTRRAARFTQADLARALRAAAKAPQPSAVEIAPDGTIRLVPIKPAEDASPNPEAPGLARPPRSLM